MYHRSTSSFLLTFNLELIKHQHFKGSESDFALHYYLPTGKNLDQWHDEKNSKMLISFFMRTNCPHFGKLFEYDNNLLDKIGKSSSVH